MQVFERPGWEYFISIQFLSPDLGPLDSPRAALFIAGGPVRGVGNECGFSRRHTAAAAGSSSRAAKAAIDHALEPKKMQLDPPWNPDPSFKVADERAGA
jgi:hypothetical protein